MAKATRGKRTASKTALKRAPAGRRRLKAKADGAFPGGSKKSKRELRHVLPRMSRS